jgi:hypothetical protein
MKYSILCRAVAFVALVQPSIVLACTFFAVHHDSKIFFCNNEDFTKPGYVWFTPKESGKYGRVNLGFDDNFAQGSMNEKGLAFDAAALQYVPWIPDPMRETPRNLLEKIMNECGTVKEALEYFEKYNCHHLADGQFLFADAEGDMAVVSWLPEQGLSISRTKADHLVVTNTRLEASGYRCQRSIRVEQVLAESKPQDVNGLAAVLDAVHQHGPGGFTSYSNIFDLKSRKIFVFNLANYSESIELDLQEELSKNHAASTPLASLFSHSPSLDDIRSGEQRTQYGTAIELSVAELDELTGTYSPESDSSVRFTVRRDNRVLLVDNPGQPTATLFSESKLSFRIAPDRGQVTFLTAEDDEMKVTGLILHKERDLRAVRVAE